MALAGCGGAHDAADTTTIINQTIVSSGASAASSPATSTSAQPQPAAGLLEPPAGATQKAGGIDHGASKLEYSINGQTPNQVIEYYTVMWRDKGFTIINSTGGADGGRKGGAVAVASKDGTFVGVEADADAGEPTHFDVCQGSDEMMVRDCID